MIILAFALTDASLSHDLLQLAGWVAICGFCGGASIAGILAEVSVRCCQTNANQSLQGQ